MRSKDEFSSNLIIILLTILAAVLILSSCSVGCDTSMCNVYSQGEQQVDTLNVIN
jgi:hypothetical protein